MNLQGRKFGFPKELHLRRPAEFRRVYDNKCSVRDDILLVHGRTNELPYSRLGLSVSRKVGSAVMRTRLRRLYREAFRLIRAEIPTRLDLVLIPRHSAEPTLHALQESLRILATALARKLAGRGPKQ